MKLINRFKSALEKRQVAGTDVVIQQLISRSRGENTTALPTALAAVETCTGVIARAFQSAEIIGPNWIKDALHPGMMGLIARALCRVGDVVLYTSINETKASAEFVPSAAVSVEGGWNRDTWMYNIHLPGPSKTTTKKKVSASSVLHFVWSRDVSTPWRGVSPIESADLDSQFLSTLVKALNDIASGPHGYFLPIPRTGGQAKNVDLLKQDIETSRGSALLVESMADSWQAGGRGQVNSDWQPKKFGADIDEEYATLYDTVNRAIMNAYGISPQLFDVGGSTREAWRVAIFGVVKPLANTLEYEMLRKLGVEVKIRFSDLRASDIQGRARAFKSLVDGGMSTEEAKKFAGFDE